MRYSLFVLMLLCGFSLHAQVSADFFVSGGYTFPTIRNERSPASHHEKSWYIGHGVDLLFDESRAVFPYAGVRISKLRFSSTEHFSNGEELVYGVENIAWSAVVGLQYAHYLADETSLRVAVGAGPYNEVESQSIRGSSLNGVAEASVGIKWRFLSLGVKLVKPMGAFGHYQWSAEDRGTEGANNYGVSIAAMELKIAPPSGPGRNAGHSGDRSGGVEFGASVGPAASVGDYYGQTERKPVVRGAMALLVFDMYPRDNWHLFSFAHGCRLGTDPFGRFTSYVLGLQMNTARHSAVGFRMSAMAGPMMTGGDWIVVPNLAVEGNAGILINHRLSVGVKYLQPVFRDPNSLRPYYTTVTEYNMRYLMGEVKMRF